MTAGQKSAFPRTSLCKQPAKSGRSTGDRQQEAYRCRRCRTSLVFNQALDRCTDSRSEKPEQVTRNLQALDVDLTMDEIAEISAIFA